jgi:hypothetical protein
VRRWRRRNNRTVIGRAMEIAFFPRWIFGGMEESKRRHLNYCVSAIALLVGLPYLRLIPHICLFRWMVGIPCPGCGITTAIAALCRLDFHGAVQANVAALPIALLLVFQILFRPLALCSSSLRREASIDRCSRFISVCASFSLCLVWIAKLIRS